MATDKISKAMQLNLYKSMVQIREFEEQVQRSFLEGLVQGTTHLCQGQEAVCAGACLALRADDYVTNTYRGHGHCLARGIDMEAAVCRVVRALDRIVRGPRRLDALHRCPPRTPGRLRHRRSGAAGRGGRRTCRAVGRRRPGVGDLLRRRCREHRRVSRSDEHRAGLEAAGAVHLREQPVRRIHADQLHHALSRTWSSAPTDMP